MTGPRLLRAVRPLGVLPLVLFSACRSRGPDPAHAATTSTRPVPAPDPRILRIESSLVHLDSERGQPAVDLDLARAMELFRVPGLSLALVDDGEIAWAKGYGTTEAGGSTPVTPKTLFQAGSVSKPVAAMGALAMVQRGLLALDEDVNARLATWKVPENPFTRDDKVTLRRLLSHTAGVTVHGFPGYDVDGLRPTLVQVLEGASPANTAPIRVDAPPGSIERYSGGGVTIEQQLMIDASGRPFPELMQKIVLGRLGMVDSTFEQPLPPELAARAACGTYADGKPVHGRWHVYPEMAAAGLWTTPTDLARFGIEIIRSKKGAANRVLSEKTTNEMLTPVLQRAGLGVFLDSRSPGQFGHNGADEGFQALWTMNWESGDGLVVMGNSDNLLAVADLVLRSVAKEYDWKWNPGSGNPVSRLLLLARVRGVDAALGAYDRIRGSEDEGSKVGEDTLNRVGLTLLQSGELSDAIRVLERNAKDFPASPNVHDSLAEAYARSGRKEDAIRCYETVLSLQPGDAATLEKLETLRESP